MPMSHTRIAVVVLIVCGLAPVAAQDWPQWRGPRRDGVVQAFREPATWPATLTKRWNVEVGTGYATPLVVGEPALRLLAPGRQRGDDGVRRRLGEGPLADELSGAVQDEPGHSAARAGTQVHADVRRQSVVHARHQRHRDRVRRDDRQADLAEARRPRRAAVPHGDVAARRRQSRDSSRGRTRQRRADRIRRGDRRRFGGAGTATARPTGLRCCSIWRARPRS